MTSENDYRFGFTEKDINSAIKDHAGIFRVGCYVPTRLEVMSMPAERLYLILDQWMWESPSNLIPTDNQIAEVKLVIEERDDLSDCKILLDACNKYIHSE